MTLFATTVPTVLCSQVLATLLIRVDVIRCTTGLGFRERGIGGNGIGRGAGDAFGAGRE